MKTTGQQLSFDFEVPDKDVSPGMRELQNWAAWQIAIPSPYPDRIPEFEKSNFEPLLWSDPDRALDCEQVIVRRCNQRDRLALVAFFLKSMDSAAGATYLSRKGYPCNHTGFTAYLDQAITKIDNVYTAFELSLSCHSKPSTLPN